MSYIAIHNMYVINTTESTCDKIIIYKKTYIYRLPVLQHGGGTGWLVNTGDVQGC